MGQTILGSKDKDMARHPCPDFKNPVIYEIRRFKNE